MAIPSTIESLSTTAASNGPAGSEQRTLADDGLRQAYAFVAQLVNAGSDIASSSTITPPSTGSSFHITGTTAITAIGSTNSWNGRVVVLIFDAALTFTHSSNLALPGSANITTAANDVAVMRQNSSGAWRCIHYQRAGSAFHIPSATGGYTIPVPASGTAFTVNGVTGATRTAIFNGSYTEYQLASTTFGYVGDRGGVIGSGSGMAIRSDAALYLAAGGANVAVTISSNRNVSIGAPASGYGLNIPTGTPASAAATGTAGDIAWDASFIYVCTATDTWKRVAIATW